MQFAMNSSDNDQILNTVTNREYQYGFVTDIETETIPKGLNEDVIRLISLKKQEPAFMLDFRLRAFRQWQKMTMPRWAHLKFPDIDFQDIIYYAAPKARPSLASMDEVDPELRRTFDKLGIPLEEQKHLAGSISGLVFPWETIFLPL
jgi:Fe-S cluster assembly protein SufB